MDKSNLINKFEPDESDYTLRIEYNRALLQALSKYTAGSENYVRYMQRIHGEYLSTLRSKYNNVPDILLSDFLTRG